MDQIHHFLHSHPLMLTKEEEVNNKCSGCEQVLADPIYGCSVCKFYLHKSCTELPEEIQNFFHPCRLILKILSYTCNACFEDGSGFSYHCKRCDFDMHVKCALRPTIQSQGVELIHHFTHWHPLRLVDQEKYLKVQCGICDKLCSGSSNPSESAYGCEECKFFLHNSCMTNIPQQINHLFHRSCPLILLTVNSYKCDGCDEDCSGLAFSCGNCEFYLDVKCALLPSVESKGADKIQHSAHQHPLALHENTDFGTEVRCRACREKCLAPCFACERCDFFLHKQCAVELPQEIHHHFHPLHPLILSSLPPDSRDDTFQCIACRGIDKFLLVYRCANCDLNLHTACAKPKLTPLQLNYGGHSHFLTFFDKTHGLFPCNICHWPAKNCFFRCVACRFNIHLYCFPSAPKTITHERHLHPLTLTSSPFESEWTSPLYDDNSDFEEFYCDVCEEKRFGAESVYFCEECKFIAEIRCVISELLPSIIISEDQSTDKAISKVEENSTLEATIANLNNEIAEVWAEKKPLDAEIEKHRVMLEMLEEKLKPITKRLEELETDHFLCNYLLNQNVKENKHPSETSTSEGLAAELS